MLIRETEEAARGVQPLFDRPENAIFVLFWFLLSGLEETRLYLQYTVHLGQV
jgi:hypothetical protein